MWMQEKVDTTQENRKESLGDSYAILESVQFKTGRKGLSFVFQKVIPWGFPGEAVVKNRPANARDAGDVGSIPGSGRFPGVGNGNPCQYSCLENSTDGGAWWATVRRSPGFGVSTWAHVTRVIPLHKVWYVYNGILLSREKGWSLAICRTWIDLEGIMLSGISQTEEDGYCVMSVICGTNEAKQI